MSITFSGRLAILQRVLPGYRAAFFDLLGSLIPGGLSVFAGKPLEKEGIASASGLEQARLTWADNLHLFDPASALYLCYQRGVLGWLEQENPQVLIVEANPRYLSTRLALRWMHVRRRPVLGWGLGAPALGGRLAGLRGWERRSFLKQLEGVIAYSQRGADEYRQEYARLGLAGRAVFTAYNAVARAPSSSPPARPEGFDGAPTVLFVGRLQVRKRLDILFRACAALPAESKPRLWIVGDGPARALFEAAAAQLYPPAEFFGARHGAQLLPLYAGADVFALPGTGGLAVQQAMAHGLPVIVAQGDGTQDDLVRPENGWQVPPDDQAAFSQALALALSDPARLRQLGAASYRIVAQEINLERMAESFMEAAATVQAAYVSRVK